MELTKEKIIETPYKDLEDSFIKGRGTFGRWSLEQFKRVVEYLKWFSSAFDGALNSRKLYINIFTGSNINPADVETDDCRELLRTIEELIDKIKSDVAVREELLHEFVNSTRSKSCRGDSCD